MSISTDDLKAQVARVKELRIADDNASALRKNAAELLDAEERKLLDMLEQAELDNFKCEHGHAIRSLFSSVRIPKEPVDVLKFRVFLEQRNEADLVWAINSAKLNSWYKEYVEECKRLGRDEIEVPGVEGVTLTPRLQFRKV